MQDTALYDIALPEISSDMASKAEAERLAKLEERTTLLMWIFGLFTVLAIGGITTAIWQISALNGRVSGIESDVRWLRSSVEEVRLTQTAANPANPQNIKEAQDVLVQAKNGNLKISPDVLRDVGEKFISASENNQGAWKAVLASLDYRSFLNTDFIPKHLPTTQAQLPNYNYYVRTRPLGETGGGVVRAFSVLQGPIIPSGEPSARLESLSAPQPHGSNVSYLVIIGGEDAIVLDGEYFRNVTIKDADVDYSGGPVKLENVTFVNCRFHFEAINPARELSSGILRAPAVNFTYPTA